MLGALGGGAELAQLNGKQPAKCIQDQTGVDIGCCKETVPRRLVLSSGQAGGQTLLWELLKQEESIEEAKYSNCWHNAGKIYCLFCEVQHKSLLFEEENTQAALLFFTVLESSLKV